jgi:toxin CptA
MRDPMHNAPSVDFPVGRSRFEASALTAAAMLGAVVTAAWALQSPPGSTGPLVAALLWLVATVRAACAWWRTGEGTLAWRHGRWQWLGRLDTPIAVEAGDPPAVPARLWIALDLQRHLLAHLDAPPARPRWLWLSRDMAPGRWDDLRRAVYSRATVDALPDPTARADAPAAHP